MALCLLLARLQRCRYAAIGRCKGERTLAEFQSAGWRCSGKACDADQVPSDIFSAVFKLVERGKNEEDLRSCHCGCRIGL